MNKETRAQPEPSRIQKAEDEMIRDFCGEVLWQIDIPSNEGSFYVFQLIRVDPETSGVREREVS